MRTLYKLLRALLHGALLFLLPWVTGAIVGMVVDVDEVSQTAGRFASLFAMIVVPMLLLQLVAIAMKIGRELRSARADGKRGFGVFVNALDKHVRVLSGRGLGMAAASMCMVAFALSEKWGELGVLAVAGLAILYLFSTIATVVSAFAVRAFDDRVRRGRGAIDREMSPTVVDAGDAVDERFYLARVPVPPLFRLHIEEALPYRLGGDTRFALDRTVSRAEVTVSAPLPRTPRGVYRVGPAEIWYEDVLGLARVHVASRATAALRALPRLRPVVFDRRPRSHAKAEGPLSVLARIATEEHYKTRQYVPGDDLRRVHWKQSINTGNLMVRVPESIPYAPTKVRLVLDTFVPPGWRVAANTDGRKTERAVARAPDALDDVLDLLVEGWIGLAQSLLRRGESVTLVAAVRKNDVIVLEEIECKRGEERRWRAVGSDVAWQNEITLDSLLAKVPSAASAKASAIVISAGLAFGPSQPAPGTSFVVADGASVVPDPPKDDLGAVRRFFFFDYPVGADDNKLDVAKLLSPRPPPPDKIRAELGKAMAGAVAFARGANAPVLLVRRRGLALSLEAP
jgi:uncharacterized protein (DUF58 family)